MKQNERKDLGVGILVTKNNSCLIGKIIDIEKHYISGKPTVATVAWKVRFKNKTFIKTQTLKISLLLEYIPKAKKWFSWLKIFK